MNRILAVLAVWILCLLAIRGFKTDVPETSPPPEATLAQATLPVEVEITTTFEGRPDPFALDLDTASALDVRFDGKPVARFSEFSASDLPLRLTIAVPDPSPALRVTARPPQRDLTPSALRVRLLAGARILADRSAWSQGEEMSITLTPTHRSDTEDGHAD